MEIIKIEFEGLKFWKTDYRFKNKAECERYFDDKLKDGVEMYKGELKRYMHENLHIYFSFYWASRLIMLVNLVGMLFATSDTSKIYILGAGIFAGITSFVFWKVYNNYMDKITMTEVFNDCMEDALYEIREDLLKKND